MKKIIILIHTLFILSCDQIRTEKKLIKCAVDSCYLIPKYSVMDEINRKNNWRIKTSCGLKLISKIPYKKGDSVEVMVISPK